MTEPDAQTLAALRVFDSLPDSAYVKPRVVMALFGGISDEGLRRAIMAGRVPNPVKLGTRSNIFQVGELRAALARVMESKVKP